MQLDTLLDVIERAPRRSAYADRRSHARPATGRGDPPPEQVEYRDDGCDIFPSCLSCPLPRCRYDVPGGLRTLINRERDQQIRSLRDDAGLTVDEIAERFQLSRRTVFRALSATAAGSGLDGRAR